MLKNKESRKRGGMLDGSGGGRRKSRKRGGMLDGSGGTRRKSRKRGGGRRKRRS
jgi:hypothetical protein